MESKKLELGETKCVKIHIGDRTDECLEQMVHSVNINEKNYETFLGDVVCSLGSKDKNKLGLSWAKLSTKLASLVI